MSNVILAVFSERDNAEDAVSRLESRGYNPKDLSIMMRDTEEAKNISERTGAGEVVSGTLGGTAAGAVLGGLAGLVASFIIPGLGAFFIGGPVAQALGLTGVAATTASGATTGALAGGILGALTSAFGLSGKEARIYGDRIREGGILIAVPAREDDEREVTMVMEEFDADNIKTVESPGRETRREEAREYGPAYLSEVRGRGTRKRGSTRRR